LNIVERAKHRLAGGKATLVLPEGDDERILQAASRLRNCEFDIRPILLGSTAAVRAAAVRLGIALGDVEILDPAANPDELALAEAYVQARPSIELALARRIVRKPLFCAGMMVRTAGADAMLAGAATPTARVIEAAMMTIGPAPGVATPSSCFLILVPGREEQGARTLLFADCALNVEPEVEALADIALASVRSMRELTGEEPRVAFLSFSTRGSGRHGSIDRVRAAVEIARRKSPEDAFDGELQADAALSERVAAIKIKDVSPVAGRANVLIFPDLNSANIGYKLVQYLGGAQVLGPFLQGFARPVSDLSRGATVEDIVNTALVTLSRAV
jgi:phosphate acetyltransferase